jgi:hypothetical protein
MIGILILKIDWPLKTRFYSHQRMMTKSIFRKQWEKWNRQKRGIDGIIIDLVYEKREGSEGRFIEYYAFFVLEKFNSAGELINSFPFMLGRDTDIEGNLNGEFKADYSGNCNSKIFCKWIQIMGMYVNDNYEDGLEAILNKAVETYRFLERNPSEYLNTYTITKNPQWRYTSLLKHIRSNKYIIVNPLTDTNWNLLVKGAHVNIEANLKLNSRSVGILCTLRVIKPRLALGKNVNFGGKVTAKGLTEISVSENIESALDNVVNALYDEIPFENSAYDYTEQEYIAATATTIIPAMDIKLHMYVRVSNIQHRDDSSVIINPELYGSLLKENETFIWFKVATNIGTSTWVIAHPGTSDMKKDDIYVTDTFLVNLNCSVGEKVALLRGDLRPPNSVTIRCRGSDKDKIYVKEYVEKMSVLTVGSTYLANTPDCGAYCGAYFDVFYAGIYGACSLKTIADVPVIFEESLKGSPLDLFNYSESEESDTE